MDMKDKVVLITGASSGFGKSMAIKLAEMGAKLILVARREDKLKELASSLKTKSYSQTLDVSDKKAVEKLFSELPEEFKNIDVLVNNAGLALNMLTADEVPVEDWEEMVDTNIKGVMYFTKGALPGMKERNTGHIVNIGSVAAILPYKGGNVYGATKAFVKQFSRNLRTDLLGSDIKVTNIEPGMAETEFSMVRFKGDKEKADAVYKDARALSADDVADAVIWSITRPLNVNIDNIEIMPIDQTWGGAVINRKN
jgi:3-hydroxy acid dehydrogenase / malonic semialdehyde reductase